MQFWSRALTTLALAVYTILTVLSCVKVIRPGSLPGLVKHEANLWSGADIIGLAALGVSLFKLHSPVTKVSLLILITILVAHGSLVHLGLSPRKSARAIRNSAGYVVDGLMIASLYCLTFIR